MSLASPSHTADANAAQRAYHTLYGDEPHIFVDPFAIHLTSPIWRALLHSRTTAAAIQPFIKHTLPMVAHQLARSRYVEERLAELQPVQYVIVGAGMDSYALRCGDGQPYTFEVDHPATQTVKRDRIERRRLQSKAIYVPLNLETGSLRDALRLKGYQEDKLTLFSWMGVTPYLTKPAIEHTLREMRGASGSEVIFDVLFPSAFDYGKSTKTGQAVFKAGEDGGEPVITGMHLMDLNSMLVRCGLSVSMPCTSLRRLFYGRTDGLLPWFHIYVVRARL